MQNIPIGLVFDHHFPATIVGRVSTSRQVSSPRPAQPRAVATRVALLRAAGEEFAAAGFHGTSLREVLVRSGLTKGALYFHFAGKQALAEAVIDEMLATKQRMLDRVSARGLDPLATLIASAEEVAELMVHDPVVRGGTRLLNEPTVPVAAVAANSAFAEEATRAQLAAAAAAGLLRPAVDVAVLARSLFVMVAGHNLICERTGTLHELPDRIAEMWRALLPLIASDAWWEQHPSRARP